MSKVTFGMSMSLDGFVGGLGDAAWPVHERLLGWKFDLASFRERIGLEGGQATIDSDIEAEEFMHTGAYVMGSVCLTLEKCRGATIRRFTRRSSFSLTRPEIRCCERVAHASPS